MGRRMEEVLLQEASQQLISGKKRDLVHLLAIKFTVTQQEHWHCASVFCTSNYWRTAEIGQKPFRTFEIFLTERYR